MSVAAIPMQVMTPSKMLMLEAPAQAPISIIVRLGCLHVRHIAFPLKKLKRTMLQDLSDMLLDCPSKCKMRFLIRTFQCSSLRFPDTNNSRRFPDNLHALLCNPKYPLIFQSNQRLARTCCLKTSRAYPFLTPGLSAKIYKLPKGNKQQG